MWETTSIQHNIVHEFYMKSQEHQQLWLLVSQLLIDLYDYHLITCCHCGAINKVESENKYLDPHGDYVFDCVWCWQWIDDHDCPDLLY